MTMKFKRKFVTDIIHNYDEHKQEHRTTLHLMEHHFWLSVVSSIFSWQQLLNAEASLIIDKRQHIFRCKFNVFVHCFECLDAEFVLDVLLWSMLSFCKGALDNVVTVWSRWEALWPWSSFKRWVIFSWAGFDHCFCSYWKKIRGYYCWIYFLKGTENWLYAFLGMSGLCGKCASIFRGSICKWASYLFVFLVICWVMARTVCQNMKSVSLVERIGEIFQ